MSMKMRQCFHFKLNYLIQPTKIVYSALFKEFKTNKKSLFFLYKLKLIKKINKKNFVTKNIKIYLYIKRK